MKTKIAFVRKHNTVSVDVSGLISVGKWLYIIREALTLAANSGSTSLLLDMRKAQWRLTMTEVFRMPEELEEAGDQESPCRDGEGGVGRSDSASFLTITF